jgi:predicted nuclease of predicted toxin-antitoxin system
VRLVADEGVDKQVVERLRQDGHDVVYIAEFDPGVDDKLVLQTASDSGVLLITADKDFGELVFRQHRVHSGVVLLRLAGVPPQRKAEIVASCLEDHSQEMAAAFIVISTNNLRIRKQPG